jgi:Mu-like prophage I protein
MADLRIENYPMQVQIVQHGAETEAPEAAEVLASVTYNGPFAGFKIVKVLIAAQDSVPDYEVAHRDPTDSTDIEVAMIAAATMPGQWPAYFRAHIGDYFVVRTRSAGTAGSIIRHQSSLGYRGNVLPTTNIAREISGAGDQGATMWIELMPAGSFTTVDGRGPFVNDALATIAATSQLISEMGGLPIDFDHAIDRAAPNGGAAPAAGWIRAVEMRGGAICGRVEWTPQAEAMLRAKEYRFVSPVFEFDRPAGAALDAQTGRIVRVLRAALTNNPALPQLPAIAASRMLRPAPLMENERAVARTLGLSDDAYRAAKAKSAGAAIASARPSSDGERVRRQVMRNCGIAEADYSAAERRMNPTPGGDRVSKFLSPSEREVCARMGQSPTVWACRKASGMSVSINSAGLAQYGANAISAMLETLAQSDEVSGNSEVAALVEKAKQAFDDYQGRPDGSGQFGQLPTSNYDERIELLAKAGAFISAALSKLQLESHFARITPAEDWSAHQPQG